MASVQEALYAFLAADTTVDGLVDGRIYPEMAPQAAALPYITYTVIDSPQYYHLTGPSGLVTARVQIDCWASGATGYATAWSVAEAVRNAVGSGTTELDGYRGTTSSVFIQKCALVDRRDLMEPPIHADEKPVRRVSLDFLINYVPTS